MENEYPEGRLDGGGRTFDPGSTLVAIHHWLECHGDVVSVIAPVGAIVAVC